MKIKSVLDPESLVPGDTSDLAHSEAAAMDSSPKGALHAGEADEQSTEPSAPVNIGDLLAAANKLYHGAMTKEKAYVTERNEIGKILIKLKADVGHGHFTRKFRDWNAFGKLNFSLKRGA